MTVANIRFVFNTDPVTFFERSRRALQHAALVFEQFFQVQGGKRGKVGGGGDQIPRNIQEDKGKGQIRVLYVAKQSFLDQKVSKKTISSKEKGVMILFFSQPLNLSYN